MAWRGRSFSTEGRIDVLSEFRYFFNARGSVRGYVCVNTHTHTPAAQTGYSDESPGIGMRYLEGLKNPDGLNLGIYVFVFFIFPRELAVCCTFVCPSMID